MSRADATVSVLSCSDWTLTDPPNPDLSITASQSDYDSDAKPPGAYLVTIEAAVVGFAEQKASTEISFILEEICDNMTLDLPPTGTDDCYTILQEDSFAVKIPVVTMTPAICATKYPVTLTQMNDDPAVESALDCTDGSNCILTPQTELEPLLDGPEYN